MWPSILDYDNVMELMPHFLKVDYLKGGRPFYKHSDCGIDDIVASSGGWCRAYKYDVNGKLYTIRCWYSNANTNLIDKEFLHRYRNLDNYLKETGLPYFTEVNFHEEGIEVKEELYPILVLNWVDGVSLKTYIETHRRAEEIENLSKNFAKMVADLHERHISHGDLQHDNILVKQNGELCLIDYDSMYIPDFKGQKELVHGLPTYQHKSRFENKFLSEKSDYFSELVIYITLRALKYDSSLYDRFTDDYLLFTQEDLHTGQTPIFDKLKRFDELKPMVETLQEFIKSETIDNLKPLEEVLKNPLDDVVDKLLRLPEHEKNISKIIKTLTDGEMSDIVGNLDRKPSITVNTHTTKPTDEEFGQYINKLKI
ncbi:MAG: protein kinase family protein [Bacteroidales bacterium]|nr:protein kinase family protein [Bacteroidales bacterium]